jgi:hypothetical protein
MLRPEPEAPGPLKLRDGGVSCFGTTCLFKGEKFLRQTSEKPGEKRKL